METDACADGIGVVLMQQGQPIAYLSKALGDKHNLKLQINMRLMITRRSSSLYSKGLIVTGEQDQELGPWFTTSGLGGIVAAKRRLFHEEIKN